MNRQQKEAAWQRGYRYLERYIEREGHSLVPYNFEYRGFKLGRWVNSQRSKQTSMNEERREALETLPNWVWDAQAAKWQIGYDYLLRFYRREGHARVPRAHLEDGYKLGIWAMAQRSRRARLSSDRQQALAKLNRWSWNYRESWWEEGYAHLTQFARREGHARVPYDHLEGDFKLWRWIANLRARRDKLSGERRRALEKLAGWVW